MARIVKARATKALPAALALLAGLVVGCATPYPDVAGAKQSWLGSSYDDVVLAWGAPARSTTLSDGREARTWVNEINRARGHLYPSLGIFGGSGNVGVGVGVGTSTPFGQELQRCERTLVFQDGRVVEQTWTGADEYCRTFNKR